MPACLHTPHAPVVNIYYSLIHHHHLCLYLLPHLLTHLRHLSFMAWPFMDGWWIVEEGSGMDPLPYLPRWFPSPFPTPFPLHSCLFAFPHTPFSPSHSSLGLREDGILAGSGLSEWIFFLALSLCPSQPDWVWVKTLHPTQHSLCTHPPPYSTHIHSLWMEVSGSGSLSSLCVCVWLDWQWQWQWHYSSLMLVLMGVMEWGRGVWIWFDMQQTWWVFTHRQHPSPCLPSCHCAYPCPPHSVACLPPYCIYPHYYYYSLSFPSYFPSYFPLTPCQRRQACSTSEWWWWWSVVVMSFGTGRTEKKEGGITPLSPESGIPGVENSLPSSMWQPASAACLPACHAALLCLLLLLLLPATCTISPLSYIYIFLPLTISDDDD